MTSRHEETSPLLSYRSTPVVSTGRRSVVTDVPSTSGSAFDVQSKVTGEKENLLRLRSWTPRPISRSTRNENIDACMACLLPLLVGVLLLRETMTTDQPAYPFGSSPVNMVDPFNRRLMRASGASAANQLTLEPQSRNSGELAHRTAGLLPALWLWLLPAAMFMRHSL